MKYIIITLIAIVFILGVACRFLFNEVSNLKEDNAALHLKNTGLITSIKEFNNAQNTATKTITKIQEKIKYVKSDCNCYELPVDDSIIEFVRGSRK